MNVSQPLQIQGPEGMQRLLGLAEEIRKDVDAGRRTAATLRTAVVFFCLSAVLLVAGSYTLLVGPIEIAGFWRFLAGMAILADGAAGTAVWLRSHAVSLKLRKDRRALAETLNILHETSEIIGQYVGMNPLEEVEFRIRLARLAEDESDTFPSVSQRHVAPMMAK